MPHLVALEKGVDGGEVVALATRLPRLLHPASLGSQNGLIQGPTNKLGGIKPGGLRMMASSLPNCPKIPSLLWVKNLGAQDQGVAGRRAGGTDRRLVHRLSDLSLDPVQSWGRGNSPMGDRPGAKLHHDEDINDREGPEVLSGDAVAPMEWPPSHREDLISVRAKEGRPGKVRCAR